jgi:hypothetical protein
MNLASKLFYAERYYFCNFSRIAAYLKAGY